ncbi:MAG: hypothetical protein IT379_39345 [Deltaproteobacteria bacterium]|nr:hypothetical protein [Deltaproteobacteria bacterium]
MMRRAWWLPVVLEAALWTVGAIVLAAIVVTAISGCDTSTRYAAARLTWSAAEIADDVAHTQYETICPTSGAPYTSQQLAECRVRLERLTRLIPLDAGHTRYISLARAVRVTRDTAAAAVLALWAAEEGDAPRDLRERLSCAATALQVLAQAFRELELELPVVAEQALTALVPYGGTARAFALGECPGVDDVATGPPRGETPAPTPTRDAGTDAGARDPWADGGAS